ncbi:hypothetical protein QUA41_31565, partial [Microcoleus sp. Pol11C1]|uniref:hypothetical protein n=1 Tax=unclassified Microcoleus TaxID=2642155 RepID=UPI002FD1A20B
CASPRGLGDAQIRVIFPHKNPFPPRLMECSCSNFPKKFREGKEITATDFLLDNLPVIRETIDIQAMASLYPKSHKGKLGATFVQLFG